MNHSFIVALLLLSTGICAQSAAPTVETIAIPGTKQSFRMALLPGGTFEMGSPGTEPGRAVNEGQHKVEVNSFWIGVHEVTFDEFFCFQFKEYDSDVAATPDFKADAVARPSPPYYDFTYGRGKADGFPATTMTQQSTLRYCQWLSDKTGDFYRLPTEAEWEYACRAGTNSAYSWGEDASKASEFAWFFDNSSGSYQKTGTKKPNPWGLYDMHGNVMEWCLDFYVEDYFQRLDTASVNPLILPTKKHARALKGGSFEDDAPALRSAARRKSDPKWQARDPQIPKSKWWNPESPFVGFRIVREMKKVSKAERDRFFERVIKD
ncbi:MAG: SUMF1/EgtB/PvdO family nonheme iron enzyme [Saprospiraceae bacterium]|nr:SUMF1/EgtB/PvdO family nonheme iron enzyme [Saprospiraceae bacterium]